MKLPTALLVIAKAPVAGRSKTRLCPPCGPAEAAALAEAALADTLAAVVATPVDRRVLVLEGAPGPWLPEGLEVIPQRGDGLDERLAAAFDDVGQQAFLIGMDTPQVTPPLLRECIDALEDDHVDAVLGPAADGGFWAVGLSGPCPEAFLGVPMSTGQTGAVQRARLVALQFRVGVLPMLRDIDVIDDAVAVAEGSPDTRFARELLSMRADFEATG